MVRLARRLLNRCQNVITLKIGIVLQDLLVRRPSTKELQNVGNANPHAPNGRAAAAFPRLNGDSFQTGRFYPHPHPATEGAAPDKPAMRRHNQVNAEDFSLGIAVKSTQRRKGAETRHRLAGASTCWVMLYAKCSRFHLPLPCGFASWRLCVNCGFRVQANSPAFKLGFHPIHLSHVGP